MAKDELEKKRRLTEEMSRERGYMPAQWAYMIEQDVDFMEAYNNLYARALMDGKALPARVREFIAIALLAYRGLDGGVYEHCRRALRLGATKQELLEVIETAVIPGGAPTMSPILKALMRIEEEDKKTG